MLGVIVDLYQNESSQIQIGIICFESFQTGNYLISVQSRSISKPWGIRMRATTYHSPVIIFNNI